MYYVGDFLRGSTVEFKWNTFGADGASITRATNGTLKLYKDHGTTERSSASGITETEDFASITGVHHVTIDLSDDTDSGFYAPGHEYQVVMTGMTIDGKTVNAVIAEFSIERLASFRVMFVGTVSGTPSTTVFAASDLPDGLDNDALTGRRVLFLGNVTAGLAGEPRVIAGFVGGSTKESTVAALTQAPAVGDRFVVV